MFSKTAMPLRNDGHEAETVIAVSVKVEGEFVSQGNVLIEGTVEGSLRTERDLRVGERAHIVADVAAANAVIAGEVRGNLNIAEKLELEPTARVFGDIRTKILVVGTGATINGRLNMGSEMEPAPEKKNVRQTGRIVEKAPALESVEAEEEKQAARILFGR